MQTDQQRLVAIDALSIANGESEAPLLHLVANAAEERALFAFYERDDWRRNNRTEGGGLVDLDCELRGQLARRRIKLERAGNRLRLRGKLPAGRGVIDLLAAGKFEVNDGGFDLRGTDRCGDAARGGKGEGGTGRDGFGPLSDVVLRRKIRGEPGRRNGGLRGSRENIGENEVAVVVFVFGDDGDFFDGLRKIILEGDDAQGIVAGDEGIVHDGELQEFAREFNGDVL